MASPSKARSAAAQLKTYRMLQEAAEHGRPCPTNIEIEVVCGYESTSMGPKVIRCLERAGLIRVERYQKHRVVEIVETGKRTALRTKIKGGAYVTRPGTWRGAANDR